MNNGVTQQEVLANNLANVNTVGYKRDVPIGSEFEAWMQQALPAPWIGGVWVSNPEASAAVDLSQGDLIATDNPFDLALHGKGFFTVNTPTGVAYTRAGNFRMDATGRLVTVEGHPVLGQKGEIRLTGQAFEVDAAGNVIVNKQVVDTLQIVEPQPSAVVRKRGGVLFDFASAPSTGTRVMTGHLERSNVNPIRDMVTMLAAFRSFEAAQRAAQSEDETLGKAINDVGRVGR